MRAIEQMSHIRAVRRITADAGIGLQGTSRAWCTTSRASRRPRSNGSGGESRSVRFWA